MKFKKEKAKQQNQEAVTPTIEAIENSDTLSTTAENNIITNTEKNDTTDNDTTIDAPADTATEEPIEKKKIPLFSKILLCIAAVSAIFYAIFLNNVQVADFFNKYVSPIIRAILSYATTWIPFSLAEMLVILIPVIVVLVVGIGIKKYSNSWRNVAVFCVIMISIASYIFSTFVFGFVPAYHGSTLDKKMNLDKQKVSAQELYSTAEIISEALAAESEHIIYNGKGSSVMPYGYNELNDKLMAAYEKAREKYDFISPLHSNIKEIMLSEPMTYTHISGVYTFFTGEANININFPDYILPYTAAHEFAHQRGIAREDEANFVAFLVCMESDDHYIRYSAYLNLYEYVIGALYTADIQGASSIAKSIPAGARSDMIAYSEFFEKYKETVVSEVSGTVNDTFLNFNGVEEGSKSYGMVVDLAVAYYKKQA